MENKNTTKTEAELAAYRARRAARFAAKHEGQVSRNAGKVLTLRNGVWTK